MAKRKPIADPTVGLFQPPAATVMIPDVQNVPEGSSENIPVSEEKTLQVEEKISTPVKRKVGRPKAADILEIDIENLKKTSIYLTEDQSRKLAIYAINHGADKSSVVRMLIDTYLK